MRRRSSESFRKKLFGQARDEAAEEIIQANTERHVRVHPLSSFRWWWDMTTIVLVAYTVVVLPFRGA